MIHRRVETGKSLSKLLGNKENTDSVPAELYNDSEKTLNDWDKENTYKRKPNKVKPANKGKELLEKMMKSINHEALSMKY